MDNPWTICGLSIESQTIYGLSWDCLWMIYGQSMDDLWTVYGESMDCLGIVFG